MQNYRKRNQYASLLAGLIPKSERIMSAIHSLPQQDRSALARMPMHRVDQLHAAEALSKEITTFCIPFPQYSGRDLSTDADKIKNDFSCYKRKLQQFDREGLCEEATNSLENSEANLEFTKRLVEERISDFYQKNPKYLHFSSSNYLSSSSVSYLSSSSSSSSFSSTSSFLEGGGTLSGALIRLSIDPKETKRKESKHEKDE